MSSCTAVSNPNAQFPSQDTKKKTIKSKKETVTKHNETGDMACMMVVRVNMKNNQIQIYSLDF